MNAIENAAKGKIQATIRRQLVNMLSHHMVQLDADDRRSAQEMLKLYDDFFSFLQQIETAVESRNPQVPFEFDAELTESIKNLEKGLKDHCMRQNAARDTKGDRGDVLDPDSWPAYNNRKALDLFHDENGQPIDLFHDENGQPLDLFHDEHGHPVDLFGDPIGQPPSDSQTQSELAKAAPKGKHSRQASKSSEAITEASSKKRRL